MRIIPLTYWIEERFEEIKKFLESAPAALSRSLSDEIETIIRLYPELYHRTKEKLIEKSRKIAEEVRNKVENIRNEVLNRLEIKRVQQDQKFMELPVIGCDTSSNTLPVSLVKIHAISGISIFVKGREVKDAKSLTDIIDSDRIRELFGESLEITLEEMISDEHMEFEDTELRFIVSALREAYLCELRGHIWMNLRTRVKIFIVSL